MEFVYVLYLYMKYVCVCILMGFNYLFPYGNMSQF